jgi:hypothetical protein
VVEKFAVAPWQTVASAGSLVVVGGCTVSVAFCEALPQAPVVVTITVCGPILSEPVGTIMLALSPSNGEPSKVHA